MSPPFSGQFEITALTILNYNCVMWQSPSLNCEFPESREYIFLTILSLGQAEVLAEKYHLINVIKRYELITGDIFLP